MQGSRISPDAMAFTASVQAVQTRLGSREAYAQFGQEHGWETVVTPMLRAFIAQQTSFYLATASRAGQPYIQHRGGPAGFLHVLDDHTLALADFAGNQQFITVGNLAENPMVHLFLMDYRQRRRIKIWGEAHVVEDDDALLQSLTSSAYRARSDRVIVIKITAWDANCPQHIPQRFEAAEVEALLSERDARIAQLQSQIDTLTKGQTGMVD